METAEFLDDPIFHHLRSHNVEKYSQEMIRRGKVVLAQADLRGVDFQQFPLDTLYLKNCYLRDADLRGCDIRHWDLEGCSIHNARISGTYFPEDVEPQELMMSQAHGTRIRARINHRVVVGVAKKKPGEGA